MNIYRYYLTLKYLKPIQIIGRLRYRFSTPKPDLAPPPPLRELSGVWIAPARRRPSMVGAEHCRFLNETHDIGSPAAWNATAVEKLWLYNLHYFDDLNAFNAEDRTDWHRLLMARWVEENPPGRGNGWEPYPTSLRMVNWIKWALSNHPLEPEWRQSLAVQTRWLVKRLEVHLLGNHLFANAKALVFAGLFFDGPEASAWLEAGMKILAHEIPEQVLADGGQFERSPMYHALALEDFLDLANLVSVYSYAIPSHWRTVVAAWPDTIERMAGWLSAMCHPDGEISFFNDTAIGIAPTPAELRDYARRVWTASNEPGSAANVLELSRYSCMDRRNLGCWDVLGQRHPWNLDSGNPCRNDGENVNSTVLPLNHPLIWRGVNSTALSPVDSQPKGQGATMANPILYRLVHLAESGYIRVCWGDMDALLDVAAIGPDYLPGHAHADCLSFELSLFGSRVLVNSGTSRYGTGPERQQQRGTAAHNTVTIDGQDSSEVWGGFRVARRARPFGLQLEETENSVVVVCAHDGYVRLPGRAVHRREWRFSPGAMEITDTIEGGFGEAVGRLFLHPGLRVQTENSGDKGCIEGMGGKAINWLVEDAQTRIAETTYHPEFGIDEPNQCLEMRFSRPVCSVRITWDPNITKKLKTP